MCIDISTHISSGNVHTHAYTHAYIDVDNTHVYANVYTRVSHMSILVFGVSTVVPPISKLNAMTTNNKAAFDNLDMPPSVRKQVQGTNRLTMPIHMSTRI